MEGQEPRTTGFCSPSSLLCVMFLSVLGSRRMASTTKQRPVMTRLHRERSRTCSQLSYSAFFGRGSSSSATRCALRLPMCSASSPSRRQSPTPSATRATTGICCLPTRNGRCSAHWPLDREPYYLETSMSGLFAADDVRHGSIKRCARRWAKTRWRWRLSIATWTVDEPTAARKPRREAYSVAAGGFNDTTMYAP
jgi:hypothetical protein